MSDAVKVPLIVRIPTPIWLIALVVITLVVDRWLGIPVLLQFKPAGFVLIGLGILCSASGRFSFLRQGAEVYPFSEKHSALVASGPFRFTRNPMYLGLVIVGFGAALSEGTWLMWLVPFVIFALDNFVIIPFEEASMQRAWGDQFLAYKRRVRRWV